MALPAGDRVRRQRVQLAQATGLAFIGVFVAKQMR